MDLFGVLVIATVTAVGGGTARDLLLDRHPVFWISDLTYLGVIASSALVSFGYTTFFRPPRNALVVADAFGLAIFTVVGAKVAMGLGAPSVVVVLMGAMTATVGGMIRDVLCDETPLILRREIYATASLIGAGLYVLLHFTRLSDVFVSVAVVALVFCLRMGALQWQLHLPSFQIDEAPK